MRNKVFWISRSLSLKKFTNTWNKFSKTTYQNKCQKATQKQWNVWESTRKSGTKWSRSKSKRSADSDTARTNWIGWDRQVLSTILKGTANVRNGKTKYCWASKCLFHLTKLEELESRRATIWESWLKAFARRTHFRNRWRWTLSSSSKVTCKTTIECRSWNNSRKKKTGSRRNGKRHRINKFLLSKGVSSVSSCPTFRVSKKRPLNSASSSNWPCSCNQIRMLLPHPLQSTARTSTWARSRSSRRIWIQMKKTTTTRLAWTSRHRR